MPLPPVRISLFPPRSARWRLRLDEHAELDHHEASDAADCLELVIRRRVDAVIVDCADDAAECSDLIRALGGLRLVPIAVSVDEGACDRSRATILEDGATLLIGAEVQDRELVAQLRAACRLTTDRADEPLRFHLESMEVEVEGRRVAVTEIQWKLLAVLNSEPGRHFSADELMERVWGYTTGPTSTVSVHMRRLRLRLEIDPSRPSLIRTMRGRGYALTGTVPAS